MDFLEEHKAHMANGDNTYIPGTILERKYKYCGICENVVTYYVDRIRKCSLYSQYCKDHTYNWPRDRDVPYLTTNKILDK